MTRYTVLHIFTLYLLIHLSESEELSVNITASTVDNVNVTNGTLDNQVDIYPSNPFMVSFQEANVPMSPFPRWFQVTFQPLMSCFASFMGDVRGLLPGNDSSVDDGTPQPARPNVLRKLVATVKQGVKNIGKAMRDLFTPDQDAKYNPHPPPPPPNARRV